MPIYLNNAATSFPKPDDVIAAVTSALSQRPTEPGRSGGGVSLADVCRQQLAELFKVANRSQIALTPSATYALNTIVAGHLFARPGAHALTTVLEHNSLLRPLAHLEERCGIKTTYLDCEADGCLDSRRLCAEIRENTRLIAVTHASNVTGCIQPIEEIARIAAEAEIPLLVDAAQSAGCIELDYSALPGRVFVAFAGHKGLLGPTGTGGMIVPDDGLAQTIVGGTGVRSEDRLHPADLPLRHEAGTMNLPGIAGLAAGVNLVKFCGVEELGRQRDELVRHTRRALADVPGIKLSPLANEDGRAGIVAFTVDRLQPEEVGFMLSESFDIETRSGLHCAPLIHESLRTKPAGNVRVSFGPFNTKADVERLIEAVEAISATCAA